MDLDLAEIDPGVRRLVALLNERGFNTTDSGDGVSKDPEARWIEHPHVFIRCESPEHMIAQSYRVVDVLTEVGVRWDGAANVEATWSPVDGVAIIMVTHVSDADLGGE